MRFWSASGVSPDLSLVSDDQPEVVWASEAYQQAVKDTEGRQVTISLHDHDEKVTIVWGDQ